MTNHKTIKAREDYDMFRGYIEKGSFGEARKMMNKQPEILPYITKEDMKTLGGLN